MGDRDDIPLSERIAGARCEPTDQVGHYPMCALCGSLVIDKDRHSAWHRKLRTTIVTSLWDETV